jgi:hypothetical protein
MDILSIIKSRGLVYLLLLLTVLAVGGAVFLNRYSYFFANNVSQAANTNYDVTDVDIKKLNTNIFQSSKFQSLQSLPTVAVDLGNLNKGKRNPFTPN